MLVALSLLSILLSPISHGTLLGVGNGLVNDTDLNATWLQDGNTFFTQSGSGANLTQATTLVNAIIKAVPTVTDDTGIHTITALDFDTSTGKMTWWGGEAWIGYLNSINYKGYSNWRQPGMRPVNGTAFNYSYSFDGSTDYGKNNTHINTTASDLGHVYYNELGNLSDVTLTGAVQTGYGLANSGPFINLQNDVYWLGTSYPLWYSNAWHFHTWNGGQGNDAKKVFFYVWAVRTGQAANNNLALSKPATASSGAAGSAATAVDGNPATGWTSASNDAEWLQVDLGATYSVNHVNLTFGGGAGQSYQIQLSSDGATWGSIYTQNNSTGATDDLTGLQGTGRYIRFQGVKRNTASGYVVNEIAVYGALSSGIGITSPGPQTTAVNNAVSLKIAAADVNIPSLPLSYSATGLPTGLTINPASGLISGSPTAVPNPNPTSVTIKVSNAHGSASTSFNWTITSQSSATNLALNHPATASSVDSTSNPPSAAVDGKSGTRWSSAYTDGQWLQVDLGSIFSIKQVKLVWETAFGKAYQIQVSVDGTTWTTIYTQSNGAGGTEDLTNLLGTGRYVRMLGVTRGTVWGYSLYEMEVYGNPAAGVSITNPGSQNSQLNSQVSLQIAGVDSSSSPLALTYSVTGLPTGLSINPASGLITGIPMTAGTSPTVTVTAGNANGSANTTFSWTVTAPSTSANLALGHTATASSVDSATNPPSAAVDGKLGTRWSSAYTNAEWLEIDLGAVHTVNRVRLTWETAYGKAYQIQVSTDGVTWTTIFTQTSGTGGTEDLTNLVGSGQYIRMLGTQRGTVWGYSLYEMEVYGN